MTLNNYQCHHQRYFCLIIVVVVVALTNSIVSTTSNEISSSSSDEYCTNIYEIFDGDSCENIVLAFQISMDELIELNPELDCGNITIGDIICLPASLNMTNMVFNSSSSELNDTAAASAKAGVCAQYYTTLSDDSCDIIAQAFQTTVTTLVELNPGLKCAELHPDQILCVPLLFSTTSTPSQCKLFYLVYEDDTCETIADAYKITRSLLVKLNPSLDCNRMPISEKICVSGGEPSRVRSCDNKYTVYPGDSCANIAHAFKITLSQLMELNPGLNCDDIPVGQVVFIPCDVLPEPAKLEQPQPQPEPQAPQYTDSCRSFYTILEGDECAMIAAEFQINVEFLLLLNPSLDCSRRLPIGLRICIPPIHFNTPYVTAEPTVYDFPTSIATTTTSTIISKKDFHETYQTSDFFTQHPGYTPVIEPEYHQEHYVSTSQPETTIDNSNQIIELTTNKTAQSDQLPYVDYQPILPQNEEIELLTTSGVHQEPMPNNSSQYETQFNQTHHRDDISKGFYVPTTTTEKIQYQAPYFPPSQYQPPQLNPVEPQQPFSSLEPLIIVVTEATDLNTMQPSETQQTSFVSYEPLGVAALPQQEQQEPMYPPPPPLLPLNPPFPPQYQEYPTEQPVYHNSDYQMPPQSFQQPEYHASENQSYVNQPPPPPPQQQQQQEQQQPIVQGKQESSYSQFSNNYQTPPTTTTTVMPQSTLAPSLSCEYLYTINIDDSCESIANAFKITTDTLLELNPGLACHYLSIGQRICLPNLRPNSESDSNGSKGYSNSNPDQQQVFTTISNSPSCKSYYTVCEGDTCQSISAAYHITTALLFYLNPNLNCDSLTLGQKVCIPAVSYFMYPVSKCENYFTVYEGDSCEYVAQGFRITIAALIQLNPGINCERLPVGTKICVPSADSYPNTPPCENYHLVSPGDTCFKIAEANGITIKKLYAINPGLNCYGLEVGRRVCVPSITYQTATISYEPAQKLMYKPTVLPYKCICYYQIVPGDTCEIIAKVYKTTIEELQALNPGLNCIYVQYGRQICVNSGEYTTYSQCRISYSVKEGDSCYTVSLKYGIDLNRITTKYDCNNLRLGQNICI